MTDLIQIGQDIKRARTAMGWTQQALAQKSGTSRARIDALENSRAPDIGFKRLLRIMNALGLDLRSTELNLGRPTLEQMIEEEEGEGHAPHLGR